MLGICVCVCVCVHACVCISSGRILFEMYLMMAELVVIYFFLIDTLHIHFIMK